jgi:hypothetical protein
MKAMLITPEVQRAVLYALRVRADEIEQRLAADKRLMDRPGIVYWTERQVESDQALNLFKEG